MLVRYKHMHIKPGGCPMVIPFALRKSASAKHMTKTVWARPFADLPEADAKAYVAADPHNFELVKENEADAAPEAQEMVEAQGVEIHDDKPAPKKRGRKPKEKVEEISA